MSRSDPSHHETDVTPSEESDQPAENPTERQGVGGTRRSGRRTRLAILGLNIVICLACFVVSGAARSGRFLSLGTDPTSIFLLHVTPTILALGPLLLVVILAAWGPWHPLIRIAIFVIATLLFTTVQQAFDQVFRWYAAAPTIDLLSFLSSMSNWLCVLGSAALGMAMIGSWARVRIGPQEIGPIRITIFSILLATALIGVLISGKTMIDTAYWRSQLEQMSGMPDMGRPEELVRSQAISLIAIAGPLVCVFACCSAAAAFNWYARIAIVATTICFTTIVYVTNSTTGPPAGLQASMKITLLSVGVMVIIVGMWIALCIRLLHDSGWPCSKRIPTSYALHRRVGKEQS
jgi:hypothetical protein